MEKQIKLQAAIEKLQVDGNRYTSLINYLKLNSVIAIEEVDGGILARILSGDGLEWGLLAVDTEAEVKNLIPRLKEEKRFAGLEEWIYSLIVREVEVEWVEHCYTYYLPANVGILDQPGLPSIPVEMTELIAQTWSYDADWTREYIRNQLEYGISAVKYVDNNPVAWAAMQDDGAMGFMYVIPEYRGRGYAQEVTYDLICKIRQIGQVPFMHIVQTNYASIRLSEKMGFKRLKNIVWFEF